MEIKFEGQPQRCEICHQSDQFDPVKNYCRRCNHSALTPTNRRAAQTLAPVEARAETQTNRCSICQHSTRFDPDRDYCSRCHNVQALRNNRQITQPPPQPVEPPAPPSNLTAVETIRFKDFLPKEISPAGVFTQACYERLESLVTRVNQWIRGNSVQVVNIETVIVPELHDQFTGEATSRSFFSWKGGHNKFQIIRVWYLEKRIFF